MTTARAPDFRLYHGNALDVLAGLLAETLRVPPPGQSLLAPDTILIPQAALRRWLQATLARRHGIAANLEFLTPGEFVARALDANLGKTADDLDPGSLHWRLYAALTDPTVRAMPAMAQLAAYMAGDDPLKAWALAGELAAVFEKYQAWRRDWLLRWEAGAGREDPQAILWRAVAAGRNHRVRRLQDYLARFSEGDALPVGLPARLFAFATINVSPDVLRVMATQARAGTLHFYLPTPVKEYWGDLQTLGARLRDGATDPFGDAATDNPLLRDWGAAGKDFVALLGSYEVVHPSGEIAAYADPEHAIGSSRADGGLRDSLLHRMQADLFHRRAVPSGDARHDIDCDDPSLQAHACHTRLRELQVLHDRVRALLEDPRFDPPLQPRDIAVLAPDIDPYAPFLDAVFAGDGPEGAVFGQRIPYTMTDASPLAAEPLAAVFLRLLALPAARFGLQDTLDLLASPPLAEAAGLDAADFERLHGWLHDAGARWGLDATHRSGLGAPADDAYTWQFALDRLLLGHASGSNDVIAGAGEWVAPWAALEGGALDALDALLRLLRVLARHQRLFAQSMPPAQWRECLLALLAALLPAFNSRMAGQPPATADGQRALERLRTLIDDFAKQAANAGFEAPIPIDVVRAHFTARLTEADTRAPLLTGGVSFARMVPMRLLPFRVICLLGMNDGEFPRRDAAAGLNRLTAELGTTQRRPGDRSTRDDDRFLFLQLFCAAQDVFYVSWLGADARDGSVREPSALVDELLCAAAAYHAQPEQAARALVLQHPLQPFSPVAFGAGDARHFSYRSHWQPAAGQLSGARAGLAPWMQATQVVAPPREPERTLSLDALRSFLLAPAQQFLHMGLGMRLSALDAASADVEPLQAPARGLVRNALQRAVFDALLAGTPIDAMQPLLRARGLLPSGPPGRRALQEIVGEVEAYARGFAQWRGAATSQSLPLEIEIDGLRLHGRIKDAWPHGVARLQFGKPSARTIIRNGLDWLLVTAAGGSHALVEFHQDDSGGIGPHRREPITRDAALAALRSLLALRAEGLQRPLPFAPYSGWALFNAASTWRGVQEAARKWHGHERGWAEAHDEALRLALRGRDPFADADELREFARVAGIVFGAVTRGRPEPIDIGHTALPASDDAGADA